MNQLAGAAMLVATCLGCGTSASPAVEATLQAPKGAAVVESVSVALPVSLPAQLYVERDAMIYARSQGVVEWLGAEMGSAVAAGRVLARLESRDQEIALARADEAHAAAVRLAQRQRELTLRGVSARADSEQVESQLHQAQLTLRQARRDLELTRVVAPFAGVVSARYARAGRYAARGDSLFRVTAMSPILAIVQVPEAEAAGVRVGSSAEVVGVAGAGTARVIRAAPIVDAASGTRQFVLQVADSRGLVPGGSVTVRMGRARRPVLALSREVIGSDGLVLVWEEGRATARAVTVGADLGDGRIEVLSGLAAGERVVRAER